MYCTFIVLYSLTSRNLPCAPKVHCIMYANIMRLIIVSFTYMSVSFPHEFLL